MRRMPCEDASAAVTAGSGEESGQSIEHDAASPEGHSSHRTLALLHPDSRLVELAVVALLVVIAAFLRFHDLPANPPGLHGDEAISGLEGRRILAEGLDRALFPARPWPAHRAALPDRPLTASLRRDDLRRPLHAGAPRRCSPSSRSTWCCGARWKHRRPWRGPGCWRSWAGTCTFPASASRSAAWPLVVVLTVGAAQEASRRGDPRWWAATGALTGLGIYVYNAQPLVIAVARRLRPLLAQRPRHRRAAIRHRFQPACLSPRLFRGAGSRRPADGPLCRRQPKWVFPAP